MMFSKPLQQHEYRRPTILGVDPGVSTGIALAHYGEDRYHFVTATCETPEQVWEYITTALDVVIIERFDAQLISKYGLHTVGVWWGIKALCWKYGIPVIEDTPTQRKPYLPYARTLVRKQDDMTKHDQRHEIDATSHVVRHLFQLGHISQHALRVP